MEGVELRPIVDARGVHLFDAREVDAIAASGKRSTRCRIGFNASGGCANGPRHSEDRDSQQGSESNDPKDASPIHTSEARAWAEQARLDAIAIRAERTRLKASRDQERATSASAERELSTAKRMLIAELEGCDDRILRRLTSAELTEVLALLEAE
jgi:hypothetical protein